MTRAQNEFPLSVPETVPHFQRMAHLERSYAQKRRNVLESSGTSSNLLARNDYRTLLFTLNDENPVEKTVHALTKWLAEKHLEIDLSYDTYSDSIDHAFDLLYDDDQKTEYPSFRARLIESNSDGQWHTTIFASSAGWIQISVSNANGKFVKVPRIAKSLLSELRLGDANVQLNSKVEDWTGKRAHELADLITSPQRRIPLFIAGSAINNDQQLAEFVVLVTKWTAGIEGLGKVIVLNGEATEILEDELDKFAPFKGTLRTYLSGVDIDLPSDSLRHRFLTRNSLFGPESPGAPQRIISGIAREQAAKRVDESLLTEIQQKFRALEIVHRLEEKRPIEHSIPSEYLGTDSRSNEPHTIPTQASAPPIAQGMPPTQESDEFVESGSLIGSPTPEPHTPSVPGSDTPGAEPKPDKAPALFECFIRWIQKLFNLDRFDRTAIERQISSWREDKEDLKTYKELFDEQSKELRALQSEFQENKELLDELELENQILEDDSRNARRDSQDAWKRIAKGHGRATEADPKEVPSHSGLSATEILDKLPNDIIFTGDMKSVKVLEETDTLSRATDNLQDTVQAMDQFLRAYSKNEATNFNKFVQSTPHGYECRLGPNKSASGESKQTMQQYGDTRRFPVPVNVDPRGEIEMPAHVRLSNGQSGHSRLHYYHDSKSNKIYIGYVGRHLRNTMTN